MESIEWNLLNRSPNMIRKLVPKIHLDVVDNAPLKLKKVVLKFECPLCGHQFLEKSSFRSHLEIHAQPQEQTCLKSMREEEKLSDFKLKQKEKCSKSMEEEDKLSDFKLKQKEKCSKSMEEEDKLSDFKLKQKEKCSKSMEEEEKLSDFKLKQNEKCSISMREEEKLSNFKLKQKEKCSKSKQKDQKPPHTKPKLKKYYIPKKEKGEFVSCEFDNFQSFLEWKAVVEKENKTLFYRDKRSNGRNKIKHYFKCHRSGVFKPKGNNIRRLKHTGSCKIGTVCHAKLIVNEMEDEKCFVKYYPLHNHTGSVEHRRLTEDEKISIAKRLIEGVRWNDIIKEIKDSAPDDFDRIHLLNMKDIENIKRKHIVYCDIQDVLPDYSDSADVTCVDEKTDSNGEHNSKFEAFGQRDLQNYSLKEEMKEEEPDIQWLPTPGPEISG